MRAFFSFSYYADFFFSDTSPAPPKIRAAASRNMKFIAPPLPVYGSPAEVTTGVCAESSMSMSVDVVVIDSSMSSSSIIMSSVSSSSSSVASTSASASADVSESLSESSESVSESASAVTSVSESSESVSSCAYAGAANPAKNSAAERIRNVSRVFLLVLRSY